MNPFAAVITDMRQKRLWPLAILLAALLIALPFLLSKSATPQPIAQLPVPGNPATTPPVPAIAQQVNPIRSRLRGHQRDPFAQSKSKSSSSQGAPAKTISASPRGAAAPTGTTAKTGTTSSAASSSRSPAVSPSSPAASPTVPAPTPVSPASPAGLTPTQVYDVAFAMTNTRGGFTTVDPLQRLSVLPSARKPLLVELGVLKGGQRVLFAVNSAATVSGPGVCIPGPLDCSVLSMRPGQLEALAGKTAGGVVYADFSVTRIHAHDLGSAAAAGQARARASTAGRAALRAIDSPVLSLFGYVERQGVVIDRRNLGVGGTS